MQFRDENVIYGRPIQEAAERLCSRAHLSWTVLLTVACTSFACGGAQTRSDREKVVPEETQEESEELYGRQQMMGDYNATTAESHAASHEDRTRPVKNPEREEKSKKR